MNEQEVNVLVESLCTTIGRQALEVARKDSQIATKDAQIAELVDLLRAANMPEPPTPDDTPAK